MDGQPSYTIILPEDTREMCDDCGKKADVEHWGTVVPDQQTGHFCLDHFRKRQEYSAKHNAPLPLPDRLPEPE